MTLKAKTVLKDKFWIVEKQKNVLVQCHGTMIGICLVNRQKRVL